MENLMEDLEFIGALGVQKAFIHVDGRGHNADLGEAVPD
ncbi:hypothetical protein FIU92_01980 [Ruegeria sp. THAF33]|nr:hypothetical protein FIU92_01980 [Ruegeria sp. THAF33]